MNCPFCGRDMDWGFVQSRRMIIYTDKEKHDGLSFLVPGKDDIRLTPASSAPPTCAAFHCPACRKVLIDY